MSNSLSEHESVGRTNESYGRIGRTDGWMGRKNESVERANRWERRCLIPRPGSLGTHPLHMHDVTHRALYTVHHGAVYLCARLPSGECMKNNTFNSFEKIASWQALLHWLADPNLRRSDAIRYAMQPQVRIPWGLAVYPLEKLSVQLDNSQNMAGVCFG